MGKTDITFKYVLATFVAVLFTWLLHEFAHWCTAEALGYTAFMSLNGTSFATHENLTDLHHTLISAAGPIITLLQAVVVFLFLKYNRWNGYLYPLLFTAFYMRLLAGGMNAINPNDEGRIGQFLGWGTYTIPVLVSVFLLYLLYHITKQYSLSWKFQATTLLLIMAFSSLLILLDQFLGIQLL
ncbi:hypothetical protein [Marixanthomonas ophiurae]|uniref:Uncharacterized protein n=1 Tax=Marixanthomonas ophiurae TaxID=387659 RepID=A0A3E1Q6C6_9FLAO|nr:hypothetical protein [Marixanthomonas ophiurae]RFN57672.1 hypothetical protein DZ858_10490 [Marixanthomonas ophiurae]